MVPPFVLSILCRGHVLVSFEGSQSAASPADQKISLTGSLAPLIQPSAPGHRVRSGGGFVRGLDPDKRSQLGAHYTSREMIERLIEPVARRPLLVAWGEVHAQIAAALPAGTAAKAGSKVKRDAPRRAETLFRGFLDRLRAFRVLWTRPAARATSCTSPCSR